MKRILATLLVLMMGCIAYGSDNLIEKVKKQFKESGETGVSMKITKKEHDDLIKNHKGYYIIVSEISGEYLIQAVKFNPEGDKIRYCLDEQKTVCADMIILE